MSHYTACHTPAQARTCYMGIGVVDKRRRILEEAAESAMQHFMLNLCKEMPRLDGYVGFKEAREELRKTLLNKAIKIFEGKN